MIAQFRFIKSIGDGYFGRQDYKDIICPNIEVRDLNHAEIKARSTMLKHFCFFNVQNAFFPYCFVTLESVTYRMRLDKQTGKIETEIV